MAGIYIHIPYCKKACHYCNFHFSTSTQNKSLMINSIIKELKIRSQPYINDTIQTIYFGGGTPSLLTKKELDIIFEKIYSIFDVSKHAEITLEANPDDLTDGYLKTLDESPINRLSIGVQSFHDSDLTWMNRAHNATEAENCIKKAQDLGLTNLSIDLIFGNPSTTMHMWEENLERSITYNVPHISCYALTVEPKTALAKMIQLKKSKDIDDDQQSLQFVRTMEFLTTNGFDHYEISNYCQKDAFAIHNTNYWKGVKYLGVGPSAHSYDGENRSFNIDNNLRYLECLEKGESANIIDVRKSHDIYNEYVMTGLRTKWGCEIESLEKFGKKYLNHFESESLGFIKDKLLFLNGNTYCLTNEGKLFADKISAELFYI